MGVVNAIPLAFSIKKLLSAFLLPPLLPALCIAAGLLMMRRNPRTGRVMAWGGLAVLWLTSTPVFINLLARPLEDVPVPRAQDLVRGDAIAILGAGVRLHAPEYGGPVPNRLALERLRYGAKLVRQTGFPVLVSGGAPYGKIAEAQVLAVSLSEDFGIEPRWIEDASLDTADNARFSATLLRRDGVRCIVLVTHAAHMRRAIGEFAVQGIEVIPAPAGFLGDHSEESEEMRLEDVFDFLPGPSAAYASWIVIHEWAGILAQKVRFFLAPEVASIDEAAK